jgi:alpha-ketoglutarate-dependent taurine dioxygenase
MGAAIMDLSLSPLAGRFGATVDRDLSDSTNPKLAETLTAALHYHRLLVFPGQHLNHADLLAASSLFGVVDTDVDRRYAVGGFPGITVVSNIAEDGGATWSSGTTARSFTPPPPATAPTIAACSFAPLSASRRAVPITPMADCPHNRATANARTRVAACPRRYSPRNVR